MEPSRVYRIAGSVVFRRTSPSLIMAFDRAKGVMYELNETASSVLDRVDGVRAVDDIVKCLLDEYEAEESAVRADVVEVLKRFESVAVVEVASVAAESER